MWLGDERITIEAAQGTVWSFVTQLEKLNRWWSGGMQGREDSIQEGRTYTSSVTTSTPDGTSTELIDVLVKEIHPERKIVFIYR